MVEGAKSEAQWAQCRDRDAEGVGVGEGKWGGVVPSQPKRDSGGAFIHVSEKLVGLVLTVIICRRHHHHHHFIRSFIPSETLKQVN